MIKKISFIFITIFLISCSPSDQEKQNIATITCNILYESRNMDAAMRIKEINFAREKLAEEPFLERDTKIKESSKYGLCKELVLNDPEYDSKLSLAKKKEEEQRELSLARKKEEEQRKLSLAKKKAEEQREKEWEANLPEIYKAFDQLPISSIEEMWKEDPEGMENIYPGYYEQRMKKESKEVK